MCVCRVKKSAIDVAKMKRAEIEIEREERMKCRRLEEKYQVENGKSVVVAEREREWKKELSPSTSSPLRPSLPSL